MIENLKQNLLYFRHVSSGPLPAEIWLAVNEPAVYLDALKSWYSFIASEHEEKLICIFLGQFSGIIWV